MLQIVTNREVSPITLDSLYHRALEHGMRIEITSNEYLRGITAVALAYTNSAGSRFSFRGVSANNVIEAFLNAFSEAKVVGINYEL